MLVINKQYDLPISVKDVDTKQGIVTGYFSSLGTVDAHKDFIHPGSYLNTIQKWGPESKQPRIKHLLDHDKKSPVGKLLVLKEDTTGLYYESKIGTHAIGRDFLLMAESGIITEHSVGIIPIKQKANREKGYNEIFEVDMVEGSSLRFWGVNENTPLLSVKSDSDLMEMFDLLEKALQNGIYTDETFLKIEAKYKSLLPIVEQRLKTIKPEPQPDEAAILELFKSRFNVN